MNTAPTEAGREVDLNRPHDAWEFCQFLKIVQEKKIAGLEEACRELEHKLAAHRGALVDAHRDLARFGEYSIRLQCQEPLPDLMLT